MLYVPDKIVKVMIHDHRTVSLLPMNTGLYYY